MYIYSDTYLYIFIEFSVIFIFPHLSNNAFDAANKLNTKRKMSIKF